VNSDDLHHLAAAYALDGLDDDERQAFESHLATCDVCTADVAEFRHTLGRVADGERVTPPPALRDAVLAEVAVTRQESPLPSIASSAGGVDELSARRARRSPATAILGIAAAVVLFATAVAVTLAFRGASVDDRLAEVLDAPDGRVVTLAPPPGTDAAGSVRVAWSASEGVVVVLADGLDPTDEGLAYELWSIGDAGATPVGVLDGAGDGRIRSVHDLPADPDAWGITVEPDTGSTVPTEPILFSATV
jgi:anti-sigma-K factor RskA